MSGMSDLPTTDPQDDPVPIRLVARREACRNTKLVLYFDTIESDACRVENFMVLTPLHHVDGGLDTGVAVLPEADGRVGLQRVYRHAIAGWTWEVPRGFIDEGETPAQAAIRELEEESGLVCDAACDLHPLGAVLPDAGIIQGRILLFAALGCHPDGRRDALSEPGIGTLRWFTLEQALAMADAGGIEDSTTLAALYRRARLKAPLR